MASTSKRTLARVHQGSPLHKDEHGRRMGGGAMSDLGDQQDLRCHCMGGAGAAPGGQVHSLTPAARTPPTHLGPLCSGRLGIRLPVRVCGLEDGQAGTGCLHAQEVRELGQIHLKTPGVVELRNQAQVRNA